VEEDSLVYRVGAEVRQTGTRVRREGLIMGEKDK